jgi:hypothetical protein
MRLAEILATVALLTLLARPVLAEPRWLACKFTAGGKEQNFHMVFDDMRGTAALFADGNLIEGTSTSITFQALRSRFPQFHLTYNRNDGALAISPAGTGGLLHGECRRAVPPPGAPAQPQ